MEDTGHDQQEEEVEDDSRGSTKRSYYGCTFCKRGFTNAQALGGHMNIHRKNRVMKKAEQEVTANSSINNAPNKVSNDESIMPCPFFSEISIEPTRYNNSIFAAQIKNLHNPRNPTSYFQYEFLNPRSQSLNVNQEFLSANLTLQIGPTHVDDNGDSRRVIQEDGEVDLELRLGHDPY